jgi:hypothetical protein
MAAVRSNPGSRYDHREVRVSILISTDVSVAKTFMEMLTNILLLILIRFGASTIKKADDCFPAASPLNQNERTVISS